MTVIKTLTCVMLRCEMRYAISRMTGNGMDSGLEARLFIFSCVRHAAPSVLSFSCVSLPLNSSTVLQPFVLLTT